MKSIIEKTEKDLKNHSKKIVKEILLNVCKSKRSKVSVFLDMLVKTQDKINENRQLTSYIIPMGEGGSGGSVLVKQELSPSPSVLKGDAVNFGPKPLPDPQWYCPTCTIFLQFSETAQQTESPQQQGWRFSLLDCI